MSNPNYEELAVRYGGLDSITTDLGHTASQLESDLSALKSAVMQAAQGWEGEAAQAFQTKMKEWDTHASAIHTALMQIGHKVTLAGGDYRGGDLKGASYFL